VFRSLRTEARRYGAVVNCAASTAGVLRLPYSETNFANRFATVRLCLIRKKIKCGSDPVGSYRPRNGRVFFNRAGRPSGALKRGPLQASYESPGTAIVAYSQEFLLGIPRPSLSALVSDGVDVIALFVGLLRLVG